MPRLQDLLNLFRFNSLLGEGTMATPFPDGFK